MVSGKDGTRKNKIVAEEASTVAVPPVAPSQDELVTSKLPRREAFLNVFRRFCASRSVVPNSTMVNQVSLSILVPDTTTELISHSERRVASSVCLPKIGHSKNVPVPLNSPQPMT